VAKFKLRPCRIIDTKVVPTNEPEWEGDWPALCALLKPSVLENTIKNLVFIKVGYFCGMIQGKQTGTLVPFVLSGPRKTNDVEFAVKADPTALERIQSIYRVEAAQWDGVIREVAS
jgi:hypothetical protein